MNSKVFNIAFAPERAARGRGGIRTTQYYELGGSWLWTLNPHFDIRLAGNLALAGDGYRDLARLANCSPGGAGDYVTSQRCHAKNLAAQGELRFRARF